MANPFARLFAGKPGRAIADFPAFVAALAARWNADAVMEPVPAASGPAAVPPPAPAAAPAAAAPAAGEAPVSVAAPPEPAGDVFAWFGDTDRPDAVLAASDADAAVLAPYLAAVLDYLAAAFAPADAAAAPAAPPVARRAVRAPAAGFKPEFRDFRRFAAGGAVQLFLPPESEQAVADLLADLGPKQFGAEVAAALDAAASAAPGAAEPAAAKPSSRLAVVEPWTSLASRLYFPAAARSGDTNLRFTPLSYGLLPGEAVGSGQADQEAWFRFGLRSESAAVGGFWVFSRPPSLEPARFAALAAPAAKLAGLALARGAAGLPGLAGATGAASPTDRPSLGPAPVFELRGVLCVGYGRFAVRAVVPAAYPLKLAALYGREESDPLAAQLFLDRMMAAGRPDKAVDERAGDFRPDGAAAPVAFVPFYELLGLVGDADYRRLVQNFLIRRYGRTRLGELLFFRRTVQADGGPKRIIVRPQAFDLERFAAALPDAVRSEFAAAVRDGASAPTAEDFLLSNEAVYEAAVGDLRRRQLELGARAVDLLGGLFARYVYPRQRRRLDAMIEQDYPFSVLRALPPRLFRAVVDGSDYRAIAAALLGREDDLKLIAGWCSKNKLGNIREELSRIKALLERGAADADELCSQRAALVKKADDIKERDRKEREREAGRGRAARGIKG